MHEAQTERVLMVAIRLPSCASSQWKGGFSGVWLGTQVSSGERLVERTSDAIVARTRAVKEMLAKTIIDDLTKYLVSRLHQQVFSQKSHCTPSRQ